jgi:predicted phage-related endonuclease
MPDDIRRGTNAFKEHEALAASRGDEVEILKKKDLIPIRAMRDNILDHPKASFLLSRCHTFEQRRAWKFNGLDFHGFVDAEGDDCIVDLKTTQDASIKKFSRSVVDFKYYWQAALYCAATGYSKRFFVIAVENTAPFNVAVYEIGKEFIDVAIAQIIDATNDFKKWDGMPMSYSKDVEMLTPPSWML